MKMKLSFVLKKKVRKVTMLGIVDLNRVVYLDCYPNVEAIDRVLRHDGRGNNILQ